MLWEQDVLSASKELATAAVQQGLLGPPHPASSFPSFRALWDKPGQILCLEADANQVGHP